MALLGFSGAEETTDLVTWWFNMKDGGIMTIPATAGFNSSPAYGLGGTNPSWQKSFADTVSGDTVIIGFNWRVLEVLGGSATLCRFRDSGDVQGGLFVHQGGHLWYYRDGTYLAHGSEPIGYEKGAYIECKVRFHDTLGTVETRVNGSPNADLSFGPGDTLHHAPVAGVNVWDTIEMVWAETNITQYFDDIYVCDGSGAAPFNDFLGPVHCQVALASGNGNSSQFLGSDADSVDNYLLVDDAAEDGDTTYVESSTDDHIDLYDVDLAIPSHDTILALEVFQAARKTDAGKRAMRSVLRAGGTNYFGTEKYVNPSFRRYAELYLTNPDTAAQFATTDTIEIGQQVRAG